MLQLVTGKIIMEEFSKDVHIVAILILITQLLQLDTELIQLMEIIGLLETHGLHIGEKTVTLE